MVAGKQLGLEVYVSACSYTSSELKQGFKKVSSFFSSFFLFLKYSKISALRWRFGEKSVWIISVLFHSSLEAVAQKAFIWERSESDPDRGGAKCPLLSIWLYAVRPLVQVWTCLAPTPPACWAK